jgi:hypothetical protein
MRTRVELTEVAIVENAWPDAYVYSRGNLPTASMGDQAA